jgi:hypothetical protein
MDNAHLVFILALALEPRVGEASFFGLKKTTVYIFQTARGRHPISQKYTFGCRNLVTDLNCGWECYCCHGT